MRTWIRILVFYFSFIVATNVQASVHLRRWSECLAPTRHDVVHRVAAVTDSVRGTIDGCCSAISDLTIPK